MARKQLRGTRSYSQPTSVVLRADPEGNEVDVSVEYTVTGWHAPATRLDPAEDPEAELDQIVGPLGEVIPLDAIEPMDADRIMSNLDEWAAKEEQSRWEAECDRRCDEARDARFDR